MCIDLFTLKKDSLRFQQPHYISRKGVIPKKGEKNHANRDKQQILIVAEKCREYENILQCIRAEDYL